MLRLWAIAVMGILTLGKNPELSAQEVIPQRQIAALRSVKVVSVQVWASPYVLGLGLDTAKLRAGIEQRVAIPGLEVSEERLHGDGLVVVSIDLVQDANGLGVGGYVRLDLAKTVLEPRGGSLVANVWFSSVPVMGESAVSALSSMDGPLNALCRDFLADWRAAHVGDN